MFGISHTEHKTNEYVWQQQVDILAGRQELLLSIVHQRKLSLFGHVCHHKTLPNIILHGTCIGANVVVAEEDRLNHGGTTSRNGQASHSRRCFPSQTTEVDERPLGGGRCLSDYFKNVWESREFV